jgi:hypothetical protein
VPGSYERRRPETTLLHRVVREHLLTLLALTKEDGAEGLPRYVEQEFRKYINCGILACGFARARCKRCGADILVAFSCKGRGICPGCGARRMANAGAHLVDHVLPDVPIRQWVLSMPFDVQRLVARDPRLLTAVLRIFIDVVSKWHVKQAAARGVDGAKTGAVSFVQRFGSTLNRHMHFHVLVLDGVYALGRDGESLAFHLSPAPAQADLAFLVAAILRRVRSLLKRRGLIGGANGEPKSPSEEHSVTEQIATPGFFADLDDKGHVLPSPPLPLKRKADSSAAEACGFSVDASVRIAAGNFEGRERLCRYGSRHPFSLERLSETADGAIAYKLKKPRHGKRFLVMTPLNFLRRLAHLIPPPFYPLIRYHGVLAPNSCLRRLVVRVATGPKAREKLAERCAELSSPPPSTSTASVTASSPSSILASQTSSLLPPAVLALAHTLLAATTSRLSHFEWATLLKRIYDVDALTCPRCDGRLEFIAVITEPEPIRDILNHLRLPSAPPVLARARDPTWCCAASLEFAPQF